MKIHYFPIIACKGRFIKAAMMDLASITYPHYSWMYRWFKDHKYFALTGKTWLMHQQFRKLICGRGHRAPTLLDFLGYFGSTINTLHYGRLILLYAIYTIHIDNNALQ